MAVVTICSDFGVTVSIVSPSISHEVMGSDTMIFVFWKLLSLYLQKLNTLKLPLLHLTIHLATYKDRMK